MKIPTYNQNNWTLFKQIFINVCELTISSRCVPLYYILSKGDNIVNGRIEGPTNSDVTPEYITKNATHYGDHFKNDEECFCSTRERTEEYWSL